MKNIVENNEPAFVGLARLREKGEVSGERIALRIIADRAIRVDFDIGRWNGSDKAVKCGIWKRRAINRLRLGRVGSKHQQHDDQQPEASPEWRSLIDVVVGHSQSLNLLCAWLTSADGPTKVQNSGGPAALESADSLDR